MTEDTNRQQPDEPEQTEGENHENHDPLSSLRNKHARNRALLERLHSPKEEES
jgi:hypothetical protein